MCVQQGTRTLSFPNFRQPSPRHITKCRFSWRALLQQSIRKNNPEKKFRSKRERPKRYRPESRTLAGIQRSTSHPTSSSQVIRDAFQLRHPSLIRIGSFQATYLISRRGHVSNSKTNFVSAIVTERGAFKPQSEEWRKFVADCELL